LDLLGSGEPNMDRFVACFRNLCEQQVTDDGLDFLAETVVAARMKEDEEYEGIRMKLEARLGSARIPIQVDIGFGDAITPAAEMTTFPTVLDFPAPILQSYPRETVVAEKFQAMVMLGIGNTRTRQNLSRSPINSDK
ncbi:MAG: nucleotidyl transferase AbiEii/AbiGii toxin family protein, partial [Aureliella sp.]